jgi:DNA repair protein RadC
MAHHIFQSETELQNILEAAPEASPSFSVSEKLARYGSSALSGMEHLTMLVGKESVALALIRHFGSLKALTRASFQELRQFLPRRSAESVVAALSMSAIADTEHARSEQLDNPESIHRACAEMKLFNQEVLRVILLDTRYRHISTVEITKGTINESLAHPRDIFRPVIGRSAYAFVLVHNHPSGDPAPSEVDIRLTRRLARRRPDFANQHARSRHCRSAFRRSARLFQLQRSGYDLMKTTKALLSELMYDFQSERWNEFELPKLSLRELLALAKLLGCPSWGSKEMVIVRLLAQRELRLKLARFTDNPEELAISYKRESLRDMCREAGIWRSGNKRALSAGLLNWRDRCRALGQAFLAEMRSLAKDRPQQFSFRF